MLLFPSLRWDEIGDLPYDLFEVLCDAVDARNKASQGR